jgi:hypothetical protein
MSWGVEQASGYCPYCGEPVQLLVDPSAGEQTYVEDCQVCCRPMVVEVLAGDPVRLNIRHEDDA